MVRSQLAKYIGVKAIQFVHKSRSQGLNPLQVCMVDIDKPSLAVVAGRKVVVQAERNRCLDGVAENSSIDDLETVGIGLQKICLCFEHGGLSSKADDPALLFGVAELEGHTKVKQHIVNFIDDNKFIGAHFHNFVF